MKIENGNKTDLLDSLVKTAQVKPQKQHVVDTNKEKNTHAFDKVELSAGKQEIDRLKASAKAQPAVRQERVELLREAIENNTYNVKGEMVARSILKSNILDELL